MPRINRIIGFITVSFILIFVAKINKMGLFSAYFKTIADVEVRNSQQMPEHGNVATITDVPSGLIQGPVWETVSGHPSSFRVELAAPGRPRLVWSSALASVDVDQGWVFAQVMPRAPGIFA